MSVGQRRPWLFLGLVPLCSVPFWALSVATEGRAWLLGLPASVTMIVVPAAVASVLTARVSGRAALRNLWSGAFGVGRVRPAWWWVVCLLSVPAAQVLGSALWGVGSPPGVVPTPWPAAPAYFALFYLGAIPEEVGWSAYATEPMVRRYGVLGAGVAIGVVWEVWHWVPFLSQGRSLGWILGMLVLGVASRCLMVLMYSRGGQSLAQMCAFHAMLNVVPMYPAGYAWWNPWLMIPGTVLAVAVAWLVSRRPARPAEE